MIIGINCGHSLPGQAGSGATGYINESIETRRVGEEVIKLLRDMGHIVVDCTVDYSSSTSENLKEIVEKANAKTLDAFYSIHFNAGGGLGTEVYTYGGKDKAGAGEILKEITSLGFKNRGIKDGKNLYVIRKTTAPSVLIEVCFVDMATDAYLYEKRGAKKIAEAIVKGICHNESEGDIVNEIFKNLNDLPDWARPTAEKLIRKGFLKGDENGLNLSEDMIRVLVINDRAGIYDM